MKKIVMTAFPFFIGAVAFSVGIWLAAQGAAISEIFGLGEFAVKYASLFAGLLTILAAASFVRAFYHSSSSPDSSSSSASLFRQSTFLSRSHRGYFYIGWIFLLIAGGFWRTQNFGENLSRGEKFFADNGDVSASAILEIIDPPEAALRPEIAGRWRADALIREFAGVKISPPCRIRVYATGEYPQHSSSQIIADKLKIFARRPPAFPLAFDASAYYRQEKISGAARIRGNYEWRKNPDSTWFLRCKNRLFLWRQRNAQRLMQLLPDARGHFSAAIVFGAVDGLNADNTTDFRLSGLGHLLAISGLHVGVAAALAWIIAGVFGASRPRRAIAAAAMVLLFLALSGGRSSALRAGIIALTYCGGAIFARPTNFWNSLGISALLILAVNPQQLFAAGFEFSYLAVIFICAGDHLWRAWQNSRAADPVVEKYGLDLAGLSASANAFHAISFRGKVKKYLATALIMSASATLGTAPLTAYYFNLAAPIGLLVNLIAIPLLTAALVGAGAILFLPTAWLLTLPALSAVAAFPAHLLLMIADYASALPHGWFSAFSPPKIFIVIYYLFFAAFFLDRCACGRRRLIYGIILPAVCVLMLISTLIKIPASPTGIYILPSEKGDRVFALNTDRQLRAVFPKEESSWNEIYRFVFSLGKREIEEVWAPQRTVIDPQFLRRCAVKKISSLTENIDEKFSDRESFSFHKNRTSGFSLHWQQGAADFYLTRKLNASDWRKIIAASAANPMLIIADEMPPKNVSPQAWILSRQIIPVAANDSVNPKIPRKNLVFDDALGTILYREKIVYRWEQNEYRKIFSAP